MALERGRRSFPFQLDGHDGGIPHLSGAGGNAVPVLEFIALQKNFGSVKALHGLDLTVRRGEVYGFLGRNGAGKSTAIRIAMGISRPNRGRVKVFGETMTAKAVAARRRIGYVAQEQSFYGWMTGESIGTFVGGFYPGWSREEYLRLLDQLDLPRRRKIRGFSNGMKAKLGLALALAHKPELLILDEPTAGLDAVARREFIEMVRDQADRSNRTTFFSSHLIDEVETAADRVGIIEEGRAIYEGDLATLSARVRRATGPTGGDLPGSLVRTEFRLLQDRSRRNLREVIVQSTRNDGFDDLALPDGWELHRMSLEDIFVSLVARSLKAPADATDPNPAS